MAITFPLDLPATTGTDEVGAIVNDIAEIEFTNINAVSGTMSPFTGQQEVQEFSRNQLVVRAQTIPLTKDGASTWWGFFRALRSGLGTFLMGDPHNIEPNGSGGGAPLVNGGSQTGTSLIIDGAPTNRTGWLLSGDWFQLGSGSNSRLYTVVEDVDTDGSGNATIEFRPELRSSPADNDVVTITDTVGLFRLTEHPSWQVDNDHLYVIKFAALEVV